SKFVGTRISVTPSRDSYTRCRWLIGEPDHLETGYAGSADLAISAKSLSGLARSPRAIKMISSTSTRRSPRSISETKLWVLPNLSAAWIWVSFARRRAAAKHAPTSRYCSGSIHTGKCSPPNLSYRRLGSQSAPALDDDLGFTQRVEDLTVEQFAAQARVEAFDEAVLP